MSFPWERKALLPLAIQIDKLIIPSTSINRWCPDEEGLE